MFPNAKGRSFKNDRKALKSVKPRSVLKSGRVIQSKCNIPLIHDLFQSCDRIAEEAEIQPFLSEHNLKILLA